MDNLPYPSPSAAGPALAMPDSGLSLMLCSNAYTAVSRPRHGAQVLQVSVKMQMHLVRVTRSLTGIARYMPWIAETSPLTSHPALPLLFPFLLELAAVRLRVHQVSAPPSNYVAAACKVSLALRFAHRSCQTLPPALVPPLTLVNLLTTAQETPSSKP